MTKKTAGVVQNKYHYAIGEYSGFVHVADEKNSELKYIDFGVLKLKKGEKWSDKLSGKEVVLVVLSGTCSVKSSEGEFKNIGKRKSVFEGKAAALYLPLNAEYTVYAELDVEVAVCKAPAERKTAAKLINPEDVKQKVVGKNNWTRDVYDIVDSTLDADRIVVGETVNRPGNWSSYPPHKHDIDNLPVESKLEELYFFKLNPIDGFGFQRIYTSDGEIDEAYTLKNNDVAAIPKGYHPVAVAGGYSIYYLWILSGKKRQLAPNDDPKHAWVKK